VTDVGEYRGRLSTCHSIIISVAGQLKDSLTGSVGLVGKGPLQTNTDY